MTDNLPDTAKKNKKDHFWAHAVLTNTYRRHSPGVTKHRNICDTKYGKDSFRGMRKFKDPRTGEKRITYEIEV